MTSLAENKVMGKVAKIKTTETEASVKDYLNSVSDEQQRNDSFVILQMMEKASGEEAKMWGKSMIGFGNKRYKSPKTGREVDWFKIGFAPRKANISLHLVLDINSQADMLAKLGKHKTGKGCLYIQKLEDVNSNVLEDLINLSLTEK